MSGRMARYGAVAAAFAIGVSLLMFSWLTLEVDFPAFEYSSVRRQLIPEEPYDNIAALVSRFLWEHRALDLTGQAFVIVAAVICCLAMLKSGEEGS